MLNLLSIPAFDSVVTNTQDYATGFTEQFLPFTYIALGVICATVLIIFFRNSIINGLYLLLSFVTGNNYDNVRITNNKNIISNSWEHKN